MTGTNERTGDRMNATTGEIRLPPLVVPLAVLLAVRGTMSADGFGEIVEKKLVETGLATVSGEPRQLTATPEARRRVLGMRWTVANEHFDRGAAILDGIAYHGWRITPRFEIVVPVDAVAIKRGDPSRFRSDLARLLVEAWPTKADAVGGK